MKKQNGDARVIVGLESRDDAGVFKINDELALVQTVDFFAPVVDDPYDYGQIAVANSLSDIYAMGATPLTALNIVGFPLNTLDKKVLAAILQGGWDKAQEAGVTILGGHSVKDAEMKYGMSVTAVIHPDKILRNNRGQVGDQLILTKAIGSGVLSTALKNEKLSDEVLVLMTKVMKQLNRDAAEIMTEHQVTACTDVTGFGLLGHLYEMTLHNDISACIFPDKVPLLPEAFRLCEEKVIPGGLNTNRTYLESYIEKNNGISETLFNLLCDPQTSGGLLFSVPPSEANICLEKLKNRDVEAAVIGEFVEEQEKSIILKAN